MPRKSFDPLAVIPSSQAIREKLAETESLAVRLRILLDLAGKLECPDDAQLPGVEAEPVKSAGGKS